MLIFQDIGEETDANENNENGSSVNLYYGMFPAVVSIYYLPFHTNYVPLE